MKEFNAEANTDLMAMLNEKRGFLENFFPLAQRKT